MITGLYLTLFAASSISFFERAFLKSGCNDSIHQGLFHSALWIAMVKVIIKVFNDSPQETIIIWGVIH